MTVQTCFEDNNFKEHDDNSSLLTGYLKETDIIKIRK